MNIIIMLYANINFDSHSLELSKFIFAKLVSYKPKYIKKLNKNQKRNFKGIYLYLHFLQFIVIYINWGTNIKIHIRESSEFPIGHLQVCI